MYASPHTRVTQSGVDGILEVALDRGRFLLDASSSVIRGLGMPRPASWRLHERA